MDGELMPVLILQVTKARNTKELPGLLVQIGVEWEHWALPRLRLRAVFCVHAGAKHWIACKVNEVDAWHERRYVRRVFRVTTTAHLGNLTRSLSSWALAKAVPCSVSARSHSVYSPVLRARKATAFSRNTGSLYAWQTIRPGLR